MIIETALVLNLHINNEILTKDQNLFKNKFEIVQEEKIDPETELLFMELFKVLDNEAIKNMQNQKTN